MASMTDYLENKLLDHVLASTSYTIPSQAYLALFTTATSDAGGGTECVGGSYARQAVNFDVASGGATQADADVTFTSMPACTVTHAAIFDAVSSGNMLLHAALASSKTVGAGDTLTFAAADVDVSMT